MNSRISFEAALDLAGVVCARLCHDIASPLGALAGTLDQAVSGDEEAAALAIELAALLTTRLRLLRAAWGGEEAPDRAELAALLPALPGAERLRLDLEGLGAGDPEALRRMAPLLLVMSASCLPRGGTIRLACDGMALLVGIEGAGAAWPNNLALCAALPESGLVGADPRTIAAPLACLRAHRLGLAITILSPQSLRLWPG